MSRPDQVEEISRETLRAWRSGSVDAFERIVKLTMRRTYSIALALVGDPDDARDLSQDAYIAAHRARRRFDAEKPFFPWFYRILKNKCLNFIKRRKRIKSAEIPLELIEDWDDECSPDRQLARRDKVMAVRKAISSLSPEHREVILLHTFEELSYAEISRFLGIPAGTVMSRLFYARKALMGALGALDERNGKREGNKA